MISAAKKIIIIPTKDIKGPTHDAWLKKVPAKREMTGSVAPQGILVTKKETAETVPLSNNILQ
jgi:hypothetical protein